MKKVLANQPAVKQASVPSVGFMTGDTVDYSGHALLPAKTASAQPQSAEADVKSYFDQYFNSKGMKF